MKRSVAAALAFVSALTIMVASAQAGYLRITYKCTNRPDLSALVFGIPTTGDVLYRASLDDPEFDDADPNDQFRFRFWSGLGTGLGGVSVDRLQTIAVPDHGVVDAIAWYEAYTPGGDGPGGGGPGVVTIMAFDAKADTFITDPNHNIVVESTEAEFFVNQCVSTPCSLPYEMPGMLGDDKKLNVVRGKEIINIGGEQRSLNGWLLNNAYKLKQLSFNPLPIVGDEKVSHAIAVYQNYVPMGLFEGGPIVKKGPGDPVFVPEICKYAINCPGCGQDPYALCVFEMRADGLPKGTMVYLFERSTFRSVMAMKLHNGMVREAISRRVLDQVGGIEALGVIVDPGGAEVRKDVALELSVTRKLPEQSKKAKGRRAPE